MAAMTIAADLEGDVSYSSRLTSAMQEEVSEALKPGPPEQVLVEAFSMAVTRHDIATLGEGKGLNDNIVNFYLAMIAQRSKRRGGPAVYAFSTFFFTKLHSCGPDGVKRWTQGEDLFAYDILLVPVHSEDPSHWCLAVVDFCTPEMVIYDSLGPRDEHANIIDDLADYLEKVSHWRDCDLDWSGWYFYPSNVPLQKDTFDCGVFLCQYAECLTRDAPILFKEKHMPYFRGRIVYEILHRRLLSW
ncbi:hypothetical protein V5799_007654 [Amblyomma americanum]|uniref:Ubiquitin-like protease family profile domain-containing protein n=1 Tax=Amblyomma americanum TaxID=6943 RepID=A0AAQ4FFM8_AMBAM